MQQPGCKSTANQAFVEHSWVSTIGGANKLFKPFAKFDQAAELRVVCSLNFTLVLCGICVGSYCQ